MKPYYEHAGITIYHGDCREVLPEFTVGQVAHVLTDPPYNSGMNYGPGTNDQQDWGTYCDWLIGIIIDLETVSAGLVMVFSSVNGMLHISSRMRPRHVCVWSKPMSFSPRQGGSAFLPHWEPCLIYGKPWGEGGRCPDWHISDVWHANPSERNGHPCPKPLALLKRLLKDVPGEPILDCFMGSGTTLVAAKNLGRKAIGIEIEEKYCEIAAKRLSQEVLDFK
jgi:site-specific DNA-methyltransferase (adenine-specific)